METIAESKTLAILDADAHGTLYSVDMSAFGIGNVSVYVVDDGGEDDGTEYYTTDWQGPQPETIEEMAEFDWVRGEDIDF